MYEVVMMTDQFGKEESSLKTKPKAIAPQIKPPVYKNKACLNVNCLL